MAVVTSTRPLSTAQVTSRPAQGGGSTRVDAGAVDPPELLPSAEPPAQALAAMTITTVASTACTAPGIEVNTSHPGSSRRADEEAGRCDHGSGRRGSSLPAPHRAIRQGTL